MLIKNNAVFHNLVLLDNSHWRIYFNTINQQFCFDTESGFFLQAFFLVLQPMVY